jgi:arginase family enzyme
MSSITVSRPVRAGRPDRTVGSRACAHRPSSARQGDRTTERTRRSPKYQEEIERGLTFGLEAAPSITDRTISTFVRGELPHFAGEMGTFLKCPFLDDVRLVKDAEVAIFGAPLDAGTTYRPGTRFGPQGIRRATNLFGTYSYEHGVDLREQLNVVDVEREGVDKIAEIALELAWQGAKAVYLSFDVDVIDAGFVPETGWPEPGGLLPREALKLVRLVSES